MSRVRFQSTCPARFCPKNDFYFWAHANCGGALFLNNRGILSCSECDAEDFIFRWKFDCGYRNNRAHEGGFEYGCLQGFLACLSSLGKLQNPPGNFIIEVTQVLMQHQNEFKERYNDYNDY